MLIPVSFTGQGGYYNKIKADVTQICDIYIGNSFSTNFEAENALNKILRTVGVSKKFIIHPCSNINNCLAVNFNGINYILYDKDFLSEISTNTSPWSKLSILAHEIGHHVYGHCIDLIDISNGQVAPPKLEQSRQMELEADEFSGFVMHKLGASLSQAQATINKYISNEDDTYSTHPKKEKRLEAIKSGYNSSLTQQYDFKENPLTFKDYFYLAANSSKDQTQYKITNYTKSINLNIGKNFNKKLKAEAYSRRGLSKSNLKDFKGAISDFNKSIELYPNNWIYRYNRGRSMSRSDDYYGAISDFNSVLKLESDFADTYVQRGHAFTGIKEYNKAIEDYDKSIELLTKNSKSNTSFGPNIQNLSDYPIESQLSAIFSGRGDAKLNLANEMNYKNYGDDWNLDDPQIKVYLYEAIEDFSKAIKIDYNNPNIYMLRGMVKTVLEIDFCDDFQKGCELGIIKACDIFNNICK